MNIYDRIDHILSYAPLVIIALGLVSNTSCFLVIVCSKEFRRMSSMVYIAFLVVTDTISLFIWNLARYTEPNLGFRIEWLSLFTCRFFSFFQYFSLEASGFLLAFVSIDRFITVRSLPGSMLKKLPFATAKSALVWSIIVLLSIFTLNSHILILNGFFISEDTESNKTSVLNRTFNASEQLRLVCYKYQTGFKVCTKKFVFLNLILIYH